MVHAVAQEMHQGGLDLLEHGPVHLGFAAVDDDLHILATLARQIPHHARKRVEHRGDRQHAGVPHVVL